jgi:hypothetical protein
MVPAAKRARQQEGSFLRLRAGLSTLLIDGEEHHITHSLLLRSRLIHAALDAGRSEGDIPLPPPAQDLRAWLHFVQEDTELGDAECVQALRVRP